MRFHESTSLCSSLTSNFSYISLDSVTEDFYQIQEEDLRRTPVPSPPTAPPTPAAVTPAPGVDLTDSAVGVSDSPVPLLS
jgi:hypothetical protein